VENEAEKNRQKGHIEGAKNKEHALSEAELKIREQYEKQIGELKKIADDYKDTLQRLQAEFENAAKRIEREKEDFRKFAGAKSIEDFLPLVDSVEQGLRQAAKSGNEEMKKGFEVLRAQFIKTLERNGVRRIETVGKKFDHTLHEVLMTGKDESKQDEEILEELGKGYTLNGKVLRPAKVKVNKKSGEIHG